MSNIHSIYQAKKQQILRQLVVTSPMLIWIHRGQKRITTESSSYFCQAEQCLVLPAPYQFGIENIPPSQGTYFAHCISPPESWTIRFLQRYGSLLPDSHEQRSVFNVSKKLVSQLEEFIDLIGMAEESELAMARAEHAWQQVLLTMATENVGHALYSHPQNNLSNTIRTLIQADLAHEWQMSSLAQKLHMSESTLRRKLSEENTSFTQIISELRMSYAIHLVMTSNHNIQQIALDIGYSSPSKFAARFEKQFGITPSALRNTM